MVTAVPVPRREGLAVALFHFVRRDPGAGRILIGLVADHALGEQAGKRLGHRDHAQLGHGAGEKARIEKMQDRVFDAADILVHRQPVIRRRLVHRFVGGRIGEAREIPGRVREGIQRVGVAHRRALASGAGRGFPRGVGIQRIALDVEVDLVRQPHRQLILGHRHHAAFGAMDHRDRAAPGPLARHQPVAQPVIHRALADAVFLQPRCDFGLGASTVMPSRKRELARRPGPIKIAASRLIVDGFRN